MLKKTITYTDFNGDERTEDFYFNLSKAELMEMELGTDGGMGEMLKRIIAAKDVKQIIKTFKKILMKAYGIKAPDGRQFIKSEALSMEFSQTEAYDDLFMELATNAAAAVEFMNAILPKSLHDHVKSSIEGLEQIASNANEKSNSGV